MTVVSIKYETVATVGLLDENVPHQPSLDLFAELRRVNVDELNNSERIAYAQAQAQAQALCALAATAVGSQLG